MHEVSSGIDIPASPSTVWTVLTDVDAYPTWNTQRRGRGDLTREGTVAARLSIPGLPTKPFRPTVTSVVPDVELRWETTLFGLDARHAFLLDPLEDGNATRFVQREQIDGRFADRFVGGLERRMRRGFEQMNVGLERRATELAETETSVVR